MFSAEPGLRVMFTNDPVLQRQKFADELTAILDSITNFDEFLHRTRLLGARHAGYGVRSPHYEQVRDALFGSFAAELGNTWTPDTEHAWGSAYDMVAEAMMLGAATAHQHG